MKSKTQETYNKPEPDRLQKTRPDELPVNKIVSSEPLAIYVIEGPLEGWHNFNKYSEIVEFCEKLMKADWEFVFDPNW